MSFQFDDNYKHVHNIHTLKDAARQAFEERMRDAKAKMGDQIGFLQRRIVYVIFKPTFSSHMIKFVSKQKLQ